MSEILLPRDIEGSLVADIAAIVDIAGVSLAVAAPPVPENLGAALPYAVIERVGGTRRSLVVDEHSVAVDVYAASWAAAQAAAGVAAGLMMNLPFANDTGVDYLKAELTTSPYNNPDPRHPTLPRVTFVAAVNTRAVVFS